MRKNVSSFATMTAWISNCKDFGKLKNCAKRHGQPKKFCVKKNSRSVTHEMIPDGISRDLLDVKVKVA